MGAPESGGYLLAENGLKRPDRGVYSMVMFGLDNQE